MFTLIFGNERDEIGIGVDDEGEGLHMLGLEGFAVRCNGLEVASQTMIDPTLHAALLGDVSVAVVAVLDVAQNSFELASTFALRGLVFHIGNDALLSIHAYLGRGLTRSITGCKACPNCTIICCWNASCSVICAISVCNVSI